MATMPSTARGRATRDRIVRAATELAAARGAAGTALDDVCARAHVSKSQLYHYFEDRDELIRVVVMATCDEVITSQVDILAQFDSLDGIERYLDAIVALQEQRHAHGGCPIGSFAGQLVERDEGARLAIGEGLQRWQTGLRTGLQTMAARGELIPEADSTRLATQILATIQGGLLLTQVRRDPNQIRIAAEAIMTLIRTNLVATPDGKR